MATATSIKHGNVVRLDKEFYKVVESVTHAGGGKAGSMVHMKLRSLATGHVAERRFAPDDKVEDVAVERVRMQFLFKEGEIYTLMNSATFDQVEMPKGVIGPAAAFLKENDEIEVEFFEERPLSVIYPPVVELLVTSAGAGTGDALKEAALENGMSVLVPHFIKEGDHVRVDVETGKYVDRVLDREVKGAKFTVAAAKPREGAPKPGKDAAPEAPPKKQDKAGKKE